MHKNKTSIMTNYGYLIEKEEWTESQLSKIKSDLTVVPEIDNKYGAQDTSPFPIYQEGNKKMLLPKFYGLEKIGPPKKCKIEINAIDRVDIKFNGELRDYQLEIINKCKKHFFGSDGKLLKYGGGVISVPPGKGKTVMGIYLAHLLGLKTLIIVHKTFLVNQWLERINQYVVNAKVGIIQQDKIDIVGKDIVIGMLQSISMKDYDDDVFESFPLVIIDEVHHLGAKVFSKALLKIQAPFTIGLSATPQRKDKLEKVFYWHLGPIIYYQGTEIDKTVQVKIYNYNTGVPNKLLKPVINFRTKQMNMAKMVTNITELNIRTEFILKLVSEVFPELPYNNNKINLHSSCYNKGSDVISTKKTLKVKTKLFPYLELLSTNPFKKFRKLLILSNRINHLKEIAKLLELKNSKWKHLIGYYIGGMKAHQLKESETKPLILATYEMASEGLDIKDLDTLILATPKSNITQSIGRILRVQAKNRTYIPIIYDIVDNVSVFMSQGRKRFRDYATNEYLINWYNVIDTGIFDLEEPLFDRPEPEYNIEDQFIEEDEDLILGPIDDVNYKEIDEFNNEVIVI